MAKEYGFIYGDYDIIRSSDLRALERATQINREYGKKYLGIGILDSELIEEGTIKSVNDRMKIVLALRGVDFVFEVTGEQLKDRTKMLEAAEQAYQEFLKTPKKEETQNSKYEYVYLPGTWDLFHTGHLENLEEALKMGKNLIVGVKSDELVRAHKNRQPFLPAEERMDVIRHLKCVDEVIQSHSRNPQIAVNTILADYGKKIDAICVGSDLIEDFEAMKQTIDPQIDIVYTSRPKDGPSTSKEVKKLKQRVKGYTSTSGKMTTTKEETNEKNQLDDDEQEV